MTQKLTQITERVWFWPHHRNPYQIQPCIGVIVSDEGTVLVDAGNSPSLARQLKEALDTAHLPVVSQIIYTHHHWDHVAGNRDIASNFGSKVVAHKLAGVEKDVGVVDGDTLRVGEIVVEEELLGLF